MLIYCNTIYAIIFKQMQARNNYKRFKNKDTRNISAEIFTAWRMAPPMRCDLNSIKEKRLAYKSTSLASYPERSVSVFTCKLSSRPLIWSEIYGTSSYRASRYRISLLAWRLISGCHLTQIPRSHWIPVYGYHLIRSNL